MKTITPPSSIELEKSVLGACLIDPGTYRQVESVLSSSDFFFVKHQWVWDAFGYLTARGEPIDYVLVCDELERDKRLTELGGAAYVGQCMNTVVNFTRAREYANRVAELAERRRTIEFASELVKAAGNENGSFASSKMKWTTALQKDSGGVTRGVVSAKDAMSKVWSDIEHNMENQLEPGEVRHLDTGLKDLNRIIGGLAKGLHMVGAVTSTGKTAFCLQIAGNVAERGRKVFYCSPEMSADMLVERIICARAKIDSRKLDAGTLDDDERVRFAHWAGRIATWPLVISENTKMSDIRAQLYHEQPALFVKCMFVFAC